MFSNPLPQLKEEPKIEEKPTFNIYNNLQRRKPKVNVPKVKEVKEEPPRVNKNKDSKIG